MYDDLSITAFNATSSVVDLVRADSYDAVSKAFSRSLYSIKALAESRFASLADLDINAVRNEMHDLRVQAQGGE